MTNYLKDIAYFGSFGNQAAKIIALAHVGGVAETLTKKIPSLQRFKNVRLFQVLL